MSGVGSGAAGVAQHQERYDTRTGGAPPRHGGDESNAVPAAVRGPLLLGLPAVAISFLVLGMAYISLPHAPLGSVVPVIVFVMGVFLIGAAFWAAGIGEPVLAATFGMLSGLGWSTAALLLGVFHNWYAIPASGVSSAQELFFLAWAALFFFFTLPALRLMPPLGAILGFVTAFLVLVTAGVFEASSTLLLAGGAAALMVALLAFFTWLRTAMSIAGRPVARPRLHLSVSRG